jgi:chloride channel protein, CIC family
MFERLTRSHAAARRLSPNTAREQRSEARSSSLGRDLPAHKDVSVGSTDESRREVADLDEPRRLGLVPLSLLAVTVGIAAGLGAIIFRELIGLIHNVLFLGHFAFHYNTEIFTPASPWGPFIILAPVVGAAAVTFLVTKFAPEAKGHGVPEVMDAIYYSDGIIRPIVAIVKSLASAIAIGSGATIGREGPIIQIGSAFGSTLGQIVRMTSAERIILIACGGGGGIAATFNTPIGGVLFAIEILMPELSARTFLPVAIATGTATFIGRYWFGLQPAFTMPPLAPLRIDATAALALCLYTALGALVGVAAAAFVRGLYFTEDLFDKIPGAYRRHMSGMLLVGIIIYGIHRFLGQYYVGGVGYATDQAILFGHLTGAGVLLLLFCCELFATAVTLGSGSSGGIFSPSLYMGATLGSAFAALLSALHLPMAINAPSFAVVGMAAMVGGGTGAVLTAITMLFEMTRDYDIVLPMILAVAASVGVRRLLSPESIYTLKLARRGHVMPDALHANMFMVKRAGSLMNRDLIVLPGDAHADTLPIRGPDGHIVSFIVVAEHNRVFGIIRVSTALARATEETQTAATLRDMASRNFCVVRERDVFFNVIRRMSRKRAETAIVLRDLGGPRADNVAGLITKENIADSVTASVLVFPTRS